jgi:hypothetical protein
MRVPYKSNAGYRRINCGLHAIKTMYNDVLRTTNAGITRYHAVSRRSHEVSRGLTRSHAGLTRVSRRFHEVARRSTACHTRSNAGQTRSKAGNTQIKLCKMCVKSGSNYVKLGMVSHAPYGPLTHSPRRPPRWRGLPRDPLPIDG